MIPGGSSQVLVLSVGNVLSSPVISVFLCQSEVDKEKLVTMTTDSHEEIIRLDVAMNEILVVDVSKIKRYS